MCGLMGWVGKDPKQFDKDKFIILGVMNESRGRHSCGVAVDGKLYKGVNQNSEFHKFVQNQDFPAPKRIPVVIGHTRWATGGAHNEENAHPFRFDFKNKKYVIGAHNGKLQNHNELAKKYGIPHKDFNIDSQVLLKILAMGHTEVLLEYVGAAAVIMYSSTSKNTMWLFKGESKEYNFSTGTKEERPLFFYQENKNSMYISSQAEALNMLCKSEKERDNNVFSFASNHLYEIKDGEIINRFKIDREKNSTQEKSHCRPRGQSAANTTTWSRNTGKSNVGRKSAVNVPSAVEVDTFPENTVDKGDKNLKQEDDNVIKLHTSTATSKAHVKNNIFYESVVLDTDDVMIHYEGLRYKEKKGNLLTGICIFMKDIGFVKVAENVYDLPRLLKNYTIDDHKSNKTIEFGDISNIKLYYFWRGVYLKHKQDYIACAQHLSNYGQKEVTFAELYQMSTYPIIDIARLEKEEKILPDAQRIMNERGGLTSDSIDPLGCFRSYKFILGKLDRFTLRKDIISPKSREDYLDAFEDGKFKEISEHITVDEEDETVFEDAIEQEIANFDEHNVKTLLDIKVGVEDAVEFTGLSLEALPKDISESHVVQMLNEFNEGTMKRFEPIAKAIDSMFKETINE